MGRSFDDFEAWLEAVDYYLDGESPEDFDQDHVEAWEAGLSAREWAAILLEGGDVDPMACPDSE